MSAYDNKEDDDKPKKGGFFRKAFGLKSKEEKRAEEAAALAEQQALVDRQMAERMAAINAAALKSAREQDNLGVDGTVSVDADEIARQEAEDKARAEAQAAKDVEAAKRLADEKRERAETARVRAEQETAAKAEAESSERVRLAREKQAAEEAAKTAAAEHAAARTAQEKLAKEKAEQDKAEQAALEQARKEQGEAEAAALKAKQHAEAIIREKQALETHKLAETDKAAAQQAEAKRQAAQTLDAERREAARLDAERLETERLDALRRTDAKAAALVKAQTAMPEPTHEPEPAPKKGFLSRISDGLRKSSTRMSENVTAIFTKRKLDYAALEELEDLLIASDLGTGTALKVTQLLSKDKFDKQVTDLEVKIALADVISETLTPLEKPLVLGTAKPQILLFVGVNGSGKTTTLGKIAARYTAQGKSVLLAAGDTFRAAAVEQLNVWGERAGAPVVSAGLGADASGLVFDAVERAKRENFDVLMIDTAGRLQNRSELMDELSKIVRVIKKQDASAPHHVILVLDATVGQNALSQTEAFLSTAGVTGLIMTKLDGTAKGGVLVALADKFALPIHAIGIGERIEDLENFSAPVFAAALSGVSDMVND